MGTIQHHAVIASTWNEDEFDRVRTWLEFEANQKSDLIPPFTMHWSFQAQEAVNGYRSIVLYPDGSKEGWESSHAGDDFRDRFIEQLEQSNYSDGSCPWSYVEVAFGELGQKVTRGNCDMEDYYD